MDEIIDHQKKADGNNRSLFYDFLEKFICCCFCQ